MVRSKYHSDEAERGVNEGGKGRELVSEWGG